MFALLGFADILFTPGGTEDETEPRDYLKSIRYSGKHFDPQMVEAFFAAGEEIDRMVDERHDR